MDPSGGTAPARSYRHLFGPVPSRRLGLSLGIDPVPRKLCSLDCVYCEVGPTTQRTIRRGEYVDADAVMAELTDYIASGRRPDWYTFSGSGEPTLHSRLGEMIRFLKARRPSPSVAVLTNGTLLGDPEVRRDLMAADLVMPSLDAATEGVFRSINRPHPSLTASEHIEGLAAFCREFPGTVALEVFLLPGYNDSPEEIRALGSALERIGADRIQLNTLDRPGAVTGLRAADLPALRAVVRDWNLRNVDIIAPAADRSSLEAYDGDVESLVLATLERRPCTVDDLARILGRHVNEVNKYLAALESEGRITSSRRDRGVFYMGTSDF